MNKVNPNCFILIFKCTCTAILNFISFNMVNRTSFVKLYLAEYRKLTSPPSLFVTVNLSIVRNSR